MTPRDEVLATVALLNDKRGTGGQSRLARILASHLPDKRVNDRTVRSWVAGRTTPSDWHLAQMRAIREMRLKKENGDVV